MQVDKEYEIIKNELLKESNLEFKRENKNMKGIYSVYSVKGTPYTIMLCSNKRYKVKLISFTIDRYEIKRIGGKQDENKIKEKVKEFLSKVQEKIKELEDKDKVVIDIGTIYPLNILIKEGDKLKFYYRKVSDINILSYIELVKIYNEIMKTRNIKVLSKVLKKEYFQEVKRIIDEELETLIKEHSDKVFVFPVHQYKDTVNLFLSYIKGKVSLHIKNKLESKMSFYFFKKYITFSRLDFIKKYMYHKFYLLNRNKEKKCELLQVDESFSSNVIERMSGYRIYKKMEEKKIYIEDLKNKEVKGFDKDMLSCLFFVSRIEKKDIKDYIKKLWSGEYNLEII